MDPEMPLYTPPKPLRRATLKIWRKPPHPNKRRQSCAESVVDCGHNPGFSPRPFVDVEGAPISALEPRGDNSRRNIFFEARLDESCHSFAIVSVRETKPFYSRNRPQLVGWSSGLGSSAAYVVTQSDGLLNIRNNQMCVLCRTKWSYSEFCWKRLVLRYSPRSLGLQEPCWNARTFHGWSSGELFVQLANSCSESIRWLWANDDNENELGHEP